MRTYGNEKTELKLTAKAQEAYNNTEPLTIIEWEEEEDHGFVLYSLRGCITADNLLSFEVIDILEALQELEEYSRKREIPVIFR